jgi:uncharacterized membrane protein YhdT
MFPRWFDMTCICGLGLLGADLVLIIRNNVRTIRKRPK